MYFVKGLVIKSTGSSYIVRMDDGSDMECHVKGNFRIRGIRSTNPVAVGDYVEIEDGWIMDIGERKNYIIRKSTNLSKESHILASNIDQVALIVTINHPVTSTTFIDRFLATCEAYRVRAFLIFNKVDLLTDEEKAQLNDLRALYGSIGYDTLAVCAKNLTADDFEQSGLSAILSGNFAAAALSIMKVASWCSCKIEAGASGVSTGGISSAPSEAASYRRISWAAS